MMAAEKLAPAKGASTLTELLRRSFVDPDLRRLLFEHPNRAANIFCFNEDDHQRLRQTSWSDLEAAVGRIIRYKLMPVQIGRRVWITPQAGSGQAEEERLEIFLDQSTTGAQIGADGISNRKGVVFGSGTHPTTRLPVQLLEKFVQPGMRVLDLGTGSGVLAIVAAKLGAESVVGLDIDSSAVEAARANARRNALDENVKMQVGGVDWLHAHSKEPFDLIVANILAAIHMQTIEQGLLRHLEPGGRVILSGMHRSGAIRVAQALYQAGAAEVKYVRLGAWYALSTTLGKEVDP
jgi:ribosomal protein L11 methyltransferase